MVVAKAAKIIFLTFLLMKPSFSYATYEVDCEGYDDIPLADEEFRFKFAELWPRVGGSYP